MNLMFQLPFLMLRMVVSLSVFFKRQRITALPQIQITEDSTID